MIWLIRLALVLLTLFSYWPVFGAQFLNWDDFGYVSDNPFVAQGLTGESLFYAWTTVDVGNWIPITWLSYLLDATLFGINPLGFHAMNVAWHIANVLLMFGVLRQLTGAWRESAMVAGLFAIHPLHVESVAWVSERKDLLSLFFLLIAIRLYQKYANQPTPKRFAAVAAVFALGLLSKPMLVTFPILLLLLDSWLFPRRWQTWQDTRQPAGWGTNPTAEAWQVVRRRLVLEKWPLFLMSLAVGLIAVIAQRSQGAIIGLEQTSLSSRIKNAFVAYTWYLEKTAVPVRLCAYYPCHEQSLNFVSVAASAGVLLAITGFVLWQRRAHLCVGWFWFVITLLPVIGLLQVSGQAYADRYVYIPHVGLFLMIVWELSYWVGRTGRVGPLIAGIGLVAALIAESGLTRAQIATWHDTEALWRQCFFVDPQNYVGHFLLGQEYMRQEKYPAAREQFNETLLLLPNQAEAIYNLGLIHHKLGDFPRAAAYYEWSLRLKPEQKPVSDALAAVSKFYVRPKATHPQAAWDELRVGTEASAKGDHETGLRHLQAAAELDPTWTLPLYFVGTALKELGRDSEARPYFEAALKIDPLDVGSEHGLRELDRVHQARDASKSAIK